MDLTRIIEKVAKQEKWSKTEASASEKEYRRFLELHKTVPALNLVLPPNVDKIWHAHILFTRQYLDDCGKLFGHVLHHEPWTEQSQFSSGDHYYAETVSEYRRVFGQDPNPQIWTRLETCGEGSGNCTSGGGGGGSGQCGKP